MNNLADEFFAVEKSNQTFVIARKDRVIRNIFPKIIIIRAFEASLYQTDRLGRARGDLKRMSAGD